VRSTFRLEAKFSRWRVHGQRAGVLMSPGVKGLLPATRIFVVGLPTVSR
jgi:hypothetical protein